MKNLFSISSSPLLYFRNFSFGRNVGTGGNGVNGNGIFSNRYLLLTNCIISTLMGALGDLVEQKCMLMIHHDDDDHDNNSKKNFAPQRTLHMAIAGFTTGFTTHWWYMFLERLPPFTITTTAVNASTATVSSSSSSWIRLRLPSFRSSSSSLRLSSIGWKIFLDQLFFSPLNISIYFITLGILERATWLQMKHELIEKGFKNIYLVEWFVWPPVQFINFTIIPLRFRVLFDNLISFGFDIYSPYVKYDSSDDDE